jgi:hypothetical protein
MHSDALTVPVAMVMEPRGQGVHVVGLVQYEDRGHCVQGGRPVADVKPAAHLSVKTHKFYSHTSLVPQRLNLVIITM